MMQTLSAQITFSCASPRIVVGRRALYECFYRRPCTSPVFLQPAVHFPRNAASSRALRLFSCRGSISCKEIGEVHVRRPAKRPFRRALPPFSCRRPCTSPVSLHEFPPLQGFGGSARHHAGKAAKCTSCIRSACRRATIWGEVHVPAPEVRRFRGKRSFPAYRCIRRVSCKDTGEMYDGLQRNGGNERKTACRAGRKTFISRISLHEIPQMQGYGGNARKRVRPALP